MNYSETGIEETSRTTLVTTVFLVTGEHRFYDVPPQREQWGLQIRVPGGHDFIPYTSVDYVEVRSVVMEP